tara:strand:- start:31 stop:237 length:207 start_codon:yes stop_codon:yes gene_type:complete
MNREIEDRYLMLDLNVDGREIGYIQVKLDDDGVALDVFKEGQSIGSTWKTYSEMGVNVNYIDEVKEDE